MTIFYVQCSLFFFHVCIVENCFLISIQALGEDSLNVLRLALYDALAFSVFPSVGSPFRATINQL
jgi:hypothetical protein